MQYFNTDNLNEFEKRILETLNLECKKNKKLRIISAAELCVCSTSKISKTVKKLGFNNYKQYVNFINDEYIPEKPASNEFDRIRDFLDNFDLTMVDKFIELLDKHDKILLFGYGPSLFCAQYLEFKLRLFINKTVITITDEFSAASLIDEKTLLIIFSATGGFSSFDNLKKIAREKGGDLLLLIEEYNTSALSDDCQVLFLTDTFQTFTTVPYQKSRIVFFIFIEEVIQHIIKRNENSAASSGK